MSKRKRNPDEVSPLVHEMAAGMDSFLAARADGQTQRRVFVVPRPVYTPIILSGVLLGLTPFSTAWLLVALPFVWIGAFSAAPNLNLVNGCLAYAAMLSGGIMLAFHLFEPLASAILLGAASGYYTGVFEQRVRMRPYVEGV